MNICPSMAAMVIKKRSQCAPDEKIIAHGNMVIVVKKTAIDKIFDKLFSRCH